MLLVFFKPSSKLQDHVFAYLRAASTSYAGPIHVLALAVDTPGPEALRLKTEQRLGVIYDGSDALSQFAGRSTPRIVILDSAGTIRVIAPGWGGEYPEWLHKELLKLVQKP